MMRYRARTHPCRAGLLACVVAMMFGCASDAQQPSSGNGAPLPNSGMTIDDITENPRLWARRRVNVSGQVVEVLPNGSLRIGRAGKLLVVVLESNGPFPQVEAGDVVRVGGFVETYRASRPIDPGAGSERAPGGDPNDRRAGPQDAYDEFYPQHSVAAQVIAEQIEILRESSR